MKNIRFSISLRGFLTLSIILVSMAFSANAATFVVNTTADTQDTVAGDTFCADAAGACSLRAAITEANALAGADIITLPAGTYTITLTGAADNTNVAGDFDLLSEITINGAGSGTTLIQGAATRLTATERVLHLRATGVPTIINDVTVRFGNYTTAAGTFGAGIRVDVGAVNATLNRVVVTQNDDGTSGGGIAVSGSNGATLTLNNCTVSNNTAGGTAAGSSTGAGIMGNNATSTININDSTVTGNTVSNTSTTVSAVGGGVSSVGLLNITNSMITNNTATSSGLNTFSGGIHVTGGTTTITGSTISGNMSNVTAGTGAAFAGGIYNQQATLLVTNSTVSGNSVSNTANPVGGAFHSGIRTLSSTLVASTTITNSTVSGNTAVGEGGGVINISGGAANSTTNITSSTVSGNMATSATSIGGGVENFTVSTGLGVVNLTNSTVSGNSANNGAGIYNNGTTSTINLNYSTVASNAATTNGGGLFQDATGVTNLKNSIVANNTAPTGPDIFGVITSQDYNHVRNTTGGTFLVETRGKQQMLDTVFFALANDVTGTDPQLLPLANNGGATFTHLPIGGSPVINTIPNGTNDCGTVITTSQNFGSRPQQNACEKGSVERVLTAAAVSISGRVLTASSRGIPNAIISINGGILGQPIYVRTNSFGNYKVEGLQVGLTYVLTVNSSKQFQFSNPTQIVNADENITNFNFISD